MKTTFTLLLLVLFTLGVQAQFELPVDFEMPGSDTAWNQFANDGDDPANLFLIENPEFADINESVNCLQFNVLPAASPWVGMWSDYFGPIEITDENHMMEMMVLKDVISSCALKLELEEFGGANVEVHVANTYTDDWELITFDMSEAIGGTFTRLTVFPDFPETREGGSTCLLDNIGFPKPVSTNSAVLEGVRLYPNPVADRMTIRYPEMEGAVISNVLGQTVQSVTFQKSNTEVIDLAKLKPGLYFITVESASGPASTKFVRE